MQVDVMDAGGWQRLSVTRFSAAIGQTWVRGEIGSREVGLIAHEGIANDYGVVVHGGAMMTFADIALGLGVGDGAPPGSAMVTAQLTYQFAGGVKIGALITCASEIVRRTSSLVFIRGLIKADDEVVGSADGIFKVMKPRE